MKTRNLPALCLSLFLAASGSHAAIVASFDFGTANGGTAPAGTELGPAGEASTWYQITGDGVFGGITVDRGRSNRNTDPLPNGALPIDWGWNGDPSTDTFTAAGGTPFNDEPNVFQDGQRPGGNDREIGARISGLDIGRYTAYAVFATTASPGAGTPQDARFGIGLGDGTTDQLNDASFNGTIANITDFDIGLTEWTPYVSDGTSYNYLEVNFTIENANDYLIMIAEDTSSGSPQGVLVGLQIVQTSAIPEPNTLGLLTLGLGVLLRRRRNLALT